MGEHIHAKEARRFPSQFAKQLRRVKNKPIKEAIEILRSAQQRMVECYGKATRSSIMFNRLRRAENDLRKRYLED